MVSSSKCSQPHYLKHPNPNSMVSSAPIPKPCDALFQLLFPSPINLHSSSHPIPSFIPSQPAGHPPDPTVPAHAHLPSQPIQSQHHPNMSMTIRHVPLKQNPNHQRVSPPPASLNPHHPSPGPGCTPPTSETAAARRTRWPATHRPRVR